MFAFAATASTYIATTIGASGALYGLLQMTPIGLAMRGAADNPRAASVRLREILAGTDGLGGRHGHGAHAGCS